MLEHRLAIDVEESFYERRSRIMEQFEEEERFAKLTLVGGQRRMQKLLFKLKEESK